MIEYQPTPFAEANAILAAQEADLAAVREILSDFNTYELVQLQTAADRLSSVIDDLLGKNRIPVKRMLLGGISAVIFILLARENAWYAWGFFTLYIAAIVAYYALKLRALRRNPDA